MHNLLDYFKSIQTGYSIVLMTKVITALAFGFSSLFLKLQGVHLYQIVLIWTIAPAIGVLGAGLLRTVYLRTFLMIGTFWYACMALALFFYSDYSFILYGLFSGLILGVFWIPMNYIFFSQSSKNRHAKDSSVYFIIGPLLGIFLPSIGASIIAQFGFKTLFLLAAFLSVIPLLYVFKKIPEKALTCSFNDLNHNFRGMRLITGVEGALHYFQAAFIPVYVLLFLKTEFEIGIFQSCLAIIGFIVMVTLAYHSDKKQKRLKYLSPLLVSMGVLIILLGTITNIYVWFIVLGIYAFLDKISLPLRFAIPMDFKEKNIGFWRASEFYGNLGRVICLGLSAASFYYSIFWLPFVLFSILSLIYPGIIKYKTEKIKFSERKIL